MDQAARVQPRDRSLRAAMPDFQANSRDLTAKVRAVKDILPQFSDDQVCLVLADYDEDVMRAVEALLLQGEQKASSKAKAAKRYDAEMAMETAIEPEAAPAETPAELQEPAEPEKRPPTAAERELMKWKKKLREIEKIEALAKTDRDKLDAMQLAKLKKKHDIEIEAAKAEQKVLLEEAARREEAAKETRRLAQEREAKEREDREARIAFEAAERQKKAEAARKNQQERQEAEARARQAAQKGIGKGPSPAGSPSRTGGAGMDILRMVQGQAPAPTNMPPMPTPPPHALGRKGDSEVPPAPSAAAPKSNGLPPATRSRNAPANRWADSSEAEFNEETRRLDDISDYTTPLDISKIPVEVQEKAARIAAELEGEQSGGGKKGSGKGAPRKGGKESSSSGYGGGKDYDRKDYGDRKGYDDRGKGGGKDRDRDGFSSPKGKGKGKDKDGKGKSSGGGYGFPKDDAFDDWVSQRRQQQPAGRVGPRS